MILRRNYRLHLRLELHQFFNLFVLFQSLKFHITQPFQTIVRGMQMGK